MDSQSHFEELFKWVRSDSRNVINATVTKFPNLGYGLQCTKPLKKNDIVLSIHRTFFLSMETCFNDKFMKEKIYPKGKDLNHHQKFILFLWKEICREKESKWFHYFLSLPKFLTNLVLWPSVCIQALQRPDLVQYANKKQQIVESEYERLLKFIEAQGLGKTVKPLTLNDYKWLYSIIESRALTYATKYDIQSQIGALVPIYDFANHDFLYEEDQALEKKLEGLNITNKENKEGRRLVSQQDYFYFDNVKGFYNLKAHKDYNEGDQVFIMYSGKPNFHFVDYYGFMPRINPNNNVSCDISLKDDERFKYFTAHFNEELAKKLQICHYLLPQISLKSLPPGYIPGIEMKKRHNFALVETLDIAVEEETLDLNWQGKTFLKIFSLPSAACAKFIRKEDRPRHRHEEDEEKEDEGEDEHHENYVDEKKETNELIQDLMNDEYFHDEMHKKYYGEMIQKIVKRLEEEFYSSLEIKSVEDQSPNIDSYQQIAVDFTRKEREILDGFQKTCGKI